MPARRSTECPPAHVPKAHPPTSVGLRDARARCCRTHKSAGLHRERSSTPSGFSGGSLGFELVVELVQTNLVIYSFQTQRSRLNAHTFLGFCLFRRGQSQSYGLLQYLAKSSARPACAPAHFLEERIIDAQCSPHISIIASMQGIASPGGNARAAFVSTQVALRLWQLIDVYF